MWAAQYLEGLAAGFWLGWMKQASRALRYCRLPCGQTGAATWDALPKRNAPLLRVVR